MRKLLFALVLANMMPDVPVAAQESLALGTKLTPFALPEASTGKPYDLAQLAGHKARVLMFVATQCPVSNAYNERMAALARDYSGRVAFVGINSNRQEGASEVAEHAKTHGFIFPVLKDSDNVQADRFGAKVTPEVFVFDESWTLRYHGRIDDSRAADAVKNQDLRLALDALLAGKEIATKDTKAFGCTIKRVAK